MKKIYKPISGLILLLLLIYIIDINEVRDIVLSANIKSILLAILFGILANLISILRWQLILKLMYKHFSFSWLLSIFAQSLSLNSVLPGGIVGGDVFRSYSVAVELPKGRKSVGLKSVVVDRFSGFWSVNFISTLAGLVIFITISFGENYRLFLGYLIALMTISVTPFFIKLYVSNLLIETFENSSHLLVTKASKIIKLIKTGADYLAATFFLSLLTQLFAVVNFWFCLQAVQIEMSFIHLIFCSTFIFLSSVLPFSIAGFGPREFGSVAILGFYGFASEALLVASVLYGLTATFQGVLGLVWFMKLNKNPFNNK